MFRICFGAALRGRDEMYIVVDCETLEEAEDIALLECRRRLNTSYISMHHLDSLIYEVREGLDVVACLKIRSL